MSLQLIRDKSSGTSFSHILAAVGLCYTASEDSYVELCFAVAVVGTVCKYSTRLAFQWVVLYCTIHRT